MYMVHKLLLYSNSLIKTIFLIHGCGQFFTKKMGLHSVYGIFGVNQFSWFMLNFLHFSDRNIWFNISASLNSNNLLSLEYVVGLIRKQIFTHRKAQSVVSSRAPSSLVGGRKAIPHPNFWGDEKISDSRNQFDYIHFSCTVNTEEDPFFQFSESEARYRKISLSARSRRL